MASIRTTPLRFVLPALLATVGLLAGSPSASAAKRVTVSPGPTAKNASVWTEISFRGVNKKKAGKIVVRGRRTGRHGYKRFRHSDNRGFSLVMKKPFRKSEWVKVYTRLRIPGARHGDYRFRVENLGAKRVKRLPNQILEDSGPQQFQSRPGLRPYKLNIRKRTPEAGNDPIFMGAKLRGNTIVAADGEPIYFQPARSTDFRTQTYRGKPALTWCEQPTKGSGTNRATYAIANRAYKVVKRFAPGNGYYGDSHEFRLTDRGTAYITTLRTVRRDLRKVGQARNGRVSDSVVQEVDLATKRVIWEWHSLDHIPIGRTYANGPRHPGQPFDYFHTNSVTDTPDGNVLISGRSTNAIYKVSRRTGHVFWDLGGKKSDYKLSKRARFSWQHDAESLSGNRISLFDNSDAPVASKPWAKQSRGLILKLNDKKKKASFVKQFIHPQHPLSATQANVQQLASGNFFIGWGQTPIVSEHKPGGKMVFDAYVSGASSVYRTYRQPWKGYPRTRVAIATRKSGHSGTAWVSWNGDTQVRKWQTLIGTNKSNLSPVGTVDRSGFETRIHLSSLPAGVTYIKVKGLNAKGKVIGSTRAVTIG